MLKCVSLGEVFGRREDKSGETGRGSCLQRLRMLPFGGWGVGAANQGRESLEGRRLTCKRE